MAIRTWLLPALAMCLGWGIRGQFGGETGAMVPGALVGLALALLSEWKGGMLFGWERLARSLVRSAG